MSSTSVFVGTRVRSSVVFANNAGASTDPTTITFKYEDPSGNETTYVYLTDAQLVKDDTGDYHVDIDTDEAGTWYTRWVGTGAIVASDEDFFVVKSTRF